MRNIAAVKYRGDEVGISWSRRSARSVKLFERRVLPYEYHVCTLYHWIQWEHRPWQPSPLIAHCDMFGLFYKYRKASFSFHHFPGILVLLSVLLLLHCISKKRCMLSVPRSCEKCRSEIRGAFCWKTPPFKTVIKEMVVIYPLIQHFRFCGCRTRAIFAH